MEYFNSAGGGTSNAPDPYAVIPQQFGNGGLPPPQSAQYGDFENNAPDYETYQQQQAAAQAAAAAAQQQQYRAQQAAQQQQSPTIYYQNQMAAAPGSYFPIHSASEHDYLADFLGPQHPPTGTSSGAVGGAAGAPYQTAVTNKDFIMQHQQRRGNQSGQQQQNQSQNQSGRQQSQQQMMGGTSNSAAVQQQYMHQHIQQQHAAAAQQMHRLQGAPINPQQFMVPPPAILQSAQIQGGGGGQQQQQVQQMHQMQMQQHSQMMQQAGGGYHPQPQQQQQGHAPGHHHQQAHHGQHHHQNQHAQHQMMPRLPMLKDWPIRCVVEGKYQSVILGTNGSTIREIAHSTHCRVEFVNLSKRERGVLGNNDRVLTVHGHGEQASKAVARILEVIQVEALKDDENVGADIVLRLRAHNQLCGRLIGKLGSSIKEIMNKTGTNITVAKYIEPVGGLGGLRQDEMLSLMERTIVIRGPSIEAVVQAESLISAKLKKCYDSDSQTRFLQAQQNSGGPLPPMPMIHGPPGGSPNAINPPALIPTPQGVIQFQHFQPSHHPATPANSFLQPGMLRIPPGVTTLRQVRMWVPDNMIGALIGAKGKNIKMIIRESHAKVKIEAPEEKVQREAEEAEKKKKREEKANEEAGENANAAGDHQEFLEDSETVTSADAIEKETPPSDRLVTINGDDVQLLKAQSFVFTKIAETNTNFPAGANEFERLFVNRIRTEVSVPTRIIGRIIGRGGQNVRELQRITAAVVKIPEDERPGELVQAEGVEEEMTLIRIYGNMLSTHNVQFRLSNLISDYYRSGEHRQKNVSGDQQQQHGARVQPQSAPHSESASPLNQMGQLGQVPPISTSSNRTSPQSATSPNSKSP